ncbi:MAG: ABC transporter permease subunit [Acidobacteriota bacterium]
MNLYDIRLLYLRELRAALRERGILVNSLLVPLLLYPVLLWGMFAAVGFVRGQEERFVSRLAWDPAQSVAAGEEVEALRKTLAEDDRLELVAVPEDAEAAIRAGDLDLLVQIRGATGGAAALGGNFEVSLQFDSAKDRSAKAEERFGEVLADHRKDWLEREADRRGVSALEWSPFRLETENLASGSDVGAYLLGLMVPLLMIIMISVGCFYPAVDATAGERERSTWETLMTVSASRASIVTAKYLYVATLGAVAGMLNLAAMTLSMRAILAPMLGGGSSDVSFQIPLSALPLMALSAVLLAMFLAAGMMVFASFARTFKEGQSMVGPFYMVSILPPLLVNSPDLELTAGWALVPVANVALLFRQALVGIYDWPLIGLVLVAEVAAVAACLWLARWVLSFEDVMTGSYEGSVLKLLKQRFRGRRAAEDAGSEGGR